MYSIKQGVAKSFKYFILFALPVLVDKLVVSYPAFFQLSIGALLVMIVNVLKIKYSVKIP
ncbi:MAG: hypothetical protein A2W47_04300 [Gammaproteobacteria bacterium RIFCSPHIGHO2_12_38_15]|nr:MAG: hypothetical protein A2W47_04300 [Gammaproteobacteria bacterium RIFCSPHIGHO2_12_38_15]